MSGELHWYRPDGTLEGVMEIEPDPPGEVVESFGAIEITDGGVWYLPEEDWSGCSDEDLRRAWSRTFTGVIDGGFGLRARAGIREVIEEQMELRNIAPHEGEEAV